MRKLGVLIGLALLLVACTSPALSAPTALPTRAPSSTPPPTSTPAPTLTPTVALPVSQGTALPLSNERITPQNLDRLKLLAQWPLTQPQIRDLAVSPDGQLVIAYNTTYDDNNQNAVIFRLDTGANPWTPSPDAGVPENAVSFSPDGKLVQIQCGIYNTADGSLVHQFGTLPYRMNLCNNFTFFPDGTRVAVGMLHKAYIAHIWTADGSQLLEDVPLSFNGQTVYGRQYTISPDGSFLLMQEYVSLYERALWLVSLPDWKLVKKFAYGTQGKFGAWELKWAFSPDSTLLAVQVRRLNEYQGSPTRPTDQPNSMEVWRLPEMTRLLQYDFHDTPCGLAFSPAGDLLAERTEKRAIFRSATDWSVVGQIEQDGCAPVVFTPDGTRLVTGGGKYLAKDPASVLVYGVMP
jgi:WD40 repeat protein